MERDWIKDELSVALRLFNELLDAVGDALAQPCGRGPVHPARQRDSLLPTLTHHWWHKARGALTSVTAAVIVEVPGQL